MQLSSRILTALAVLILAVAVVAVRAGSPGTVEAATGTINVINVGTCYTTDTDVFNTGDCDDGDGNKADSPQEGYEVAGRDTATKATAVFATYPIDPKTSGDVPRAILVNSDLIKISIEDKERDKRSGVLYKVETPTTDLAEAQEVLKGTLDADLIDRNADGDIALTNDDANFDGPDAVISRSSLYQYRLTAAGSTEHPMAPKDDGKVYWFGTVTGGADPGFADLTNEYVELDEDLNSGSVERNVAPWMRVSVQVPSDVTITIEYIYYQTSEEEELIGGAKDGAYPERDGKDVSPVFVDDEALENNPDPDALVLRAIGDGNVPRQNLHLKEVGRFLACMRVYLRITDADGDGDSDGDSKTVDRDNWGRETRDADGPDMGDAAVLGVESGPITISYKNSNGDPRVMSITIDKTAPAIQIDLPLHNTSSKDDSPELIGTFNDGGGSGLRDESFQIYADNRPDKKTDANPVWDLGVSVVTPASEYRGYVCVDADDDPAGDCEDGSPAASLRGNYAGYGPDRETFGIVKNSEIYLPENDGIDDPEDDYKTGDAEPYEDGALSGEFDTVVRIDFPPDEEDGRRYNHIIDLQAVVIDIAGNVGFSDSQPSDPTFIHDLGTEDDRDDAKVHNVLGWFSRHLYLLDDVDPKFSEGESATGFFVDSDGDVMRTSTGVMIAFDGKLDPASVGVGTFDVDLDGGSDGTVVDVAVEGDKVYLLLEEELAPNATPGVALASGQSISDLAGNESTDRRLPGIELSDGILPTFSITLSGGTGLNDDIDGEGPSELTNEDGINISITANEPIQGAPKFVVVCSNLAWGDNADNDVAKFAENRTKTIVSGTIDSVEPNATHSESVDTNGVDMRTMCGGHVKAAVTKGDSTEFFLVIPEGAHSRSGNRWEYEWFSRSGDEEVEDGGLSVIVWGRDRSSYRNADDKRLFNYSASTANFGYDTDLEAAWEGNGELVPDEDEDVFEVRPFVLLDFGDEDTTVDVTTFEVDGIDYTADLEAIEDNEFVWWPQPLSYGTYEVYVEANDAANNTDEHTYSFTVKERAAFVLDLLAGWNSISFPANPIDRALHAVFTNPAVDQVIGWNVTEPVSPWRMATRVDGVWTTNDEFATLNDVEARYGYWVHSTGFITQAVDLAGKGDRSTDGQPNPSDIPTDQGWNFVGVVDVDGDQTQDDAGETLRNSNNDPITAAEYLGNYTRAYTWDHINNTWDVVKKDEGITIGTGIWVYYTSDHDIAP